MFNRDLSTYEIDQSGKVEHTNRQTIVALANGNIATIKISSVEKVKLISAIKEIEFPKHLYIYKIFATLIFILTRNYNIKQIIIDKEYPGHESIIKDTLTHLYKKHDLRCPHITFGLIGKKSNAHLFALSTFQGKRKAEIIVGAKNILEALYKGNKKGRRSRSSRDNP